MSEPEVIHAFEHEGGTYSLVSHDGQLRLYLKSARRTGCYTTNDAALSELIVLAATVKALREERLEIAGQLHAALDNPSGVVDPLLEIIRRLASPSVPAEEEP